MTMYLLNEFETPKAIVKIYQIVSKLATETEEDPRQRELGFESCLPNANDAP